MNKYNTKCLIVIISIVLFPIITLSTVSAHLLADYSTTSAGGNLSPVTYTTTHWVSDVHFAVYSYQSGDPIAGESGYQDFAPAPISVTNPDDQTSCMTVGTEYLYVYQIDHDPSALSNITGFNVGIISAALGTITSVGYTNDTDVNIFGLGSGDLDDGPLIANFSTGAQSVQYNYIINNVEAGEESFTLYFTSTREPTFNSASLLGGGKGDEQQLPSPENDSDGDGIYDDGDNSSFIGDNTCSGGNTTNCDDNCIDTPNPDQTDVDVDGVGDVCDTCPVIPVRNAQTSEYYSTPQDAYDDPITVNGDTILSQATSFIENLIIDRPISVTLGLGYDCDYNDPPTGITILNGNMIISNGTATIQSGTFDVQ